MLLETKPLERNFVISTKFKVNDITKRWSLFSIKNKNNEPLLRIGFEHVGVDLTRITLHRSFLDNSKLKFHENNITLLSNFTNKWFKLVIDVSEYDVIFEINCAQQYSAANSEDKILSDDLIQLTGDMKLILAASNDDFEVSHLTCFFFAIILPVVNSVILINIVV